MQELIEYIELNIDDNDFIKHEVLEQADKLIELEKEQICNAYVEGLEGLWISAEEYYNREFNQNK